MAGPAPRLLLTATAVAVTLSPVAVAGYPAGATATARAGTHATATSCPPTAGVVRRAAPGADRTVALTFDDGPGASTSVIMEALRQRRVTATFFNLGVHEAARPALVRAEARAGFALGDHTWDHGDLTKLGAARQAREIDRERALQARLTGHESCLLRPPYGYSDATTSALARARHLQIWNWSVDPEDWKAAGSRSAYWVHRIVGRAEAGVTQRHPVIILHNQTGGNPATVAALGPLISFYRAHGFRFVDLYGDTGRPFVAALSESAGPTAGGKQIVIRGGNFRDVTGVRFGATTATGVRVTSTRTIAAVTPPHEAGTVYVTVASGDHGTSVRVAAARYRYVPD